MKLKMLKALWGMEGTLEEQFARISEAGYAGIEAGLPSKEEEKHFRELLLRYDFEYIAMVFTGGEDHLSSFKEQVSYAATFNPLSITAHSMRDDVPIEQQIAYFSEAVAFEREIGIPVGHETHRGRALFNPWDTARVLQAVPQLMLTADFSHWCNVTESTLEPYESFVTEAVSRVQHIHGRIGYAEGPQVPDPRAPEYAHEVSRHFGWWEQMVREMKNRGSDTVTFTPEFGPPGYMHTLPFTNQPVADLWDVCLWTGRTFKEKFNS